MYNQYTGSFRVLLLVQVEKRPRRADEVKGCPLDQAEERRDPLEQTQERLRLDQVEEGQGEDW